MSSSARLLLRFGSLGDVVLTFAAGAAWKASRPETPLVYVVKEPLAPLVRAQPWVDEVIALDDASRGLLGAVRLGGALRKRRWESVLDLQDSLRSRWLAAATGSPVARWRAERWARRRRLRQRGLHKNTVALEPVWKRYAEAARRLGAAEAERPRLHWNRSAESAADDLWRRWGNGGEPVVALAPGAAWPTKAWPESRFLAVGRHLAASGKKVLVVSTPAERRRLSELDEWVDEEPRAQWLTAPLLTVAACLARCRAAVTGDTGLMHVSAAAGTPVVALFGSTTPDFGFAPAGPNHRVIYLGLPCQPCALHGRKRCPLGHLDCLHRIPPALALEQLAPLLADTPPAAAAPVLAKARSLW